MAYAQQGMAAYNATCVEIVASDSANQTSLISRLYQLENAKYAFPRRKGRKTWLNKNRN